MSDLTITATNSTFFITVASLYLVPVKLEGFAADAAFATEDVENAELVMGIDANLSAGYVAVATPQIISIMPNSPSLQLFEDWMATEQSIREKLRCDGTCSIPSIGRSYIMTKGYLSRIKQIPDVKKTVQPVEYRITWQSVSGASI